MPLSRAEMAVAPPTSALQLYSRTPENPVMQANTLLEELVV